MAVAGIEPAIRGFSIRIPTYLDLQFTKKIESDYPSHLFLSPLMSRIPNCEVKLAAKNEGVRIYQPRFAASPKVIEVTLTLWQYLPKGRKT